MLSIIIPTISGREESLERAIEAYKATTVGVVYEIIVVKDEPTWPRACNVGYERSSGDIIHWTADDLEALPGWYDDIPAALERDELPAPAVYDYRADGKFSNEEDGPDGALTWFTRIPICRRDQAERIGLWPEIVYYADIWFSEKARAVGIETRLLYSYRFVHHWCGIGRVDSKRNLDQSGRQLKALRREWEEHDASQI